MDKRSAGGAGRFFVRTFGCQMNEHDSERLAGMLAASGMRAADALEDADVVVLNTCCIRENADNRLYGNLGHLKELKSARPGMRVVVVGCLAQKDGDAVRRRAPHVDVVVGTHNLHRVPQLLADLERTGPATEIWAAPESGDATFTSTLPAMRRSAHSAWVTIQTGCDNACAFCIVPSVRGPEVSRPMADVVGEVRRLAREGAVEVTLLGQNVNSYGRDLTRRERARAGGMAALPRIRPLFAELLREVGAVPGIRRVRFTSPHPKDLRPETVAAMAETPAVCEQLHLPLQSGSDRVLAEMRRGYDSARYLEKLATARALCPDLAVTTDIIVGFPGETEADFEATLELCAEVRFDGAYTFQFSPRPGTRAAEMPERHVARATVQERFERLVAVTERSARMRGEARVGMIEEVLVDGPSKRSPSMATGRTRQGKLVHFPAGRDGAIGPGALADVEIHGARAHYLTGDVREMRAEPPRRRIPLASLAAVG